VKTVSKTAMVLLKFRVKQIMCLKYFFLHLFDVLVVTNNKSN